MTTSDTSFLDYEYPNELEVFFTENWRHQSIMVDAITETEDGLVHFGFTENGNKSVWQTLVTMNTNAKLPTYFENALELLDEEGEWYLDTHQNKLYYKPRYFETMTAADFVIPGQTTLLKMTGNAVQAWHVQNITLKNLDFEYTTWNYPTTNRSFRNDQNAAFTNLNGGMLMEGAVELYDVKNITVDNCDFSKIGSMALKMTGAVQHCDVIGNEFYDIAGTAIALGDMISKDARPQAQIVNPTLEKYYVTDDLIANNYIHKVATEYYSAAAISATYPKNTTIRNNEITDCPYSGIHTGWGWAAHETTGTTNFVIEKNYFHDLLNWRIYDGAGLYMLGATGGTVDNPNIVRGNYFEDMKNNYGAMYPDEGSTYWKITDNVIDQGDYPVHYGKEHTELEARWINIWTTTIQHIYAENNYSTTAGYRDDGLYTEIEAANHYPNGNWPSEAQAIIDAAGIEPAYKNRFDFDIQSVKMPRKLEVSRGSTTNMAYSVVSSKDRVCDISDVQIRVSSSNPSVATATASTITGVSAGKAWITLELYRAPANGRQGYYDKHTFYVIVE